MNVRRRALLGLAGGAGVCAALGRAQADDAFPQSVTLMVAGPRGGGLDSASQALAPGLRSHLPSGTMVALNTVGGVDGVTGANRFSAQSAPDGGSVLLVPGAAAIAWLVGDSRVHFDPSRWLPVLAQVDPAVVAVRRGKAVAVGTRLRVAAEGGGGAALAAMLGLDLLGAAVTPVYGVSDDADAIVALAAGKVDAALLRAETAGSELARGVATPLFACGAPDMDGSGVRSQALPDVPTLSEYAAAVGRPVPAGARYMAWRCAASAAQLRYALVLPSLTPPSAVALWRQAGAHALASDAAGAPQMIYASAAAGLMQSLTLDGTAVLDLRSWLATRLGWQAG